jgi:hypothetical protein
VLYGCEGEEIRTLELESRKATDVDPSKVRLIPPERAIQQATDSDLDISTLKPGDVCQGRVTDLDDIGAVVDLGGVEGLIHISELSWSTVSRPDDVLQIGERVEVLVLNVDRERARVGLSLKRLQADPWDGAPELAPVGPVIEAKENEPYLYRAAIPGAGVVAGLYYWIEALDAEGRQAVFPAGGPDDPLAVIVTEDERPPTVSHEPIRSAPAGQPLTVTAQVYDPSGMAWVRLRYRSVTQFQDYSTLEMRPTGRADEYQATVPAEHLDPQWDWTYLIEAMDACGNGAIYPDLEVETPYIVVRLERGGRS